MRSASAMFYHARRRRIDPGGRGPAAWAEILRSLANRHARRDGL